MRSYSLIKVYLWGPSGQLYYLTHFVEAGFKGVSPKLLVSMIQIFHVPKYVVIIILQ